MAKLKRTLLLLIFAFTCASLYSFTAAHLHQKKGFVLSGHISGINEGVVYLTHTYYKDDVTDSATIKNGNFTFKGYVQQPLMYTIKFKGSRMQIGVFVENSLIDVFAKINDFNSINVSGSKTQDEWANYLKAWKNVTTYAGAYYHFADSVRKAHNDKPDAIAKDQIKAFERRLKDLDLEMHTAYVKEHPNSIICAYVIETHFINYFEFKEAEELFSYLSPHVKNSYYGKQVTESLMIEKRSGIGARPDFVMNDVNGKPVKLSSYRGKYVLVDFWASWCAPCRRENPNVLANYKLYHNSGFDVLGVSLDKNKAAWQKAITADELPWVHVSDLKGWDNAAAVEFGVKVVPSNFLLDPDGKVIAKNIREEQLTNKLKEIFKQK